MGMPLLNGILILMTIIVAARVLVQIEGGAKIARKDYLKSAQKWQNRKGFSHAKHNSITEYLLFLSKLYDTLYNLSITNKPIKPI